MADPTIHSADGSADAGGGTSIAAPAIATTTGRFLIALVSNYTSGGAIAVSDVDDTAANAFVRAGSSQGGDANHVQETWYTPSPITGNAADVLTAAFASGANYRVAAMLEVSLAGATAMAYDAESTIVVTSAGTTHTSNSLTTTAADALIILGAVVFDSDQEISNGTATVVWENGAGGVDTAAMAYRLTDAAGSYTASLATGANTQIALTAKAFRFTSSSPDVTVGASGSASTTGSGTQTPGTAVPL